MLYVKIFDNGKMYVGITQNFYKRMFVHEKDAYKKMSKLPVHCAMRKHNHRTEIWANNIDDRELLYMLEKQTIAQLKSYGVILYNATSGGEGCDTPKTKEWKEKIANAIKGEKHYMFGKHLQQSTKDKLSKRFSGEGNPFYNKHHSVETIAKIKETKKKPKEYFENHPTDRWYFKKICDRNNWDYNDFIEQFHSYHIKNNSDIRAKKFIYIERR